MTVGRAGSWPRWPRCMCGAPGWTGRRCCLPVGGGSGPPTRSRLGGTGRSRPPSPAARGRAPRTCAFQRRRCWPQPARGAGGDGSEAAESRFWAAVEDGDVREIAGALAVDERAGLDRVLPALAAWRRRAPEVSVVAGWRYRVGWVRVADPGPVVLTGRWLVVVPAESDDGLADGCVRGLAARGAGGLVVEADQGEADQIGRASCRER